MQAFAQAPAWLCLQLPRFVYHSRGWATKRMNPYVIPHHVQVPIFSDPGGLEVRWDTYSAAAFIQHHGQQPITGHYTAVLRRQGQLWLYDDEKRPELLSSEQLEHLSINMYIITIVHSSVVAQASRSDSPAPPPDAAEEPGRSITAVPQSERSQLDHLSAVSASSSARGTGRGHAEHTTSPEPSVDKKNHPGRPVGSHSKESSQ